MSDYLYIQCIKSRSEQVPSRPLIRYILLKVVVKIVHLVFDRVRDKTCQHVAYIRPTVSNHLVKPIVLIHLSNFLMSWFNSSWARYYHVVYLLTSSFPSSPIFVAIAPRKVCATSCCVVCKSRSFSSQAELQQLQHHQGLLYATSSSNETWR